MDVKDLHIPDTNDPNELRLFIIKLRDMLIENAKKEEEYKRELEGCRVLVDSAVERIDTIYKNLDNRQLHDYKTNRRFNIFE